MASVQGKEQKRIGEYIRQRRKEIKLTQTQLGELLGVGTQAVSDYEKGKIKVIPYEKRVKLAEILSMPLGNLIYSFECISKSLTELNKACERDIDIFVREKPNIVDDFFNSKYYVSLEKRLNEVGSSLNKNNQNYDSKDLLRALEFYEFMSQYIDMFFKNSFSNLLLMEFLKNYTDSPFASEIAEKLTSVFIDE